MIYFGTLYFCCSRAEAHRLQDKLGIARYMSVNGDSPVVTGEKGMEVLKTLEAKKKIQLRRTIKTGIMSKAFENVIAAYLKSEADGDPMFRAKMEAHPEKDTKAVCEYITSEVYRLGAGGYEDDEIYSMAKHFIDEDELKPQKFNHANVRAVVNHKVELTAEEKAVAKAQAKSEYLKQVKAQEAEKEARAMEKAKERQEKKKAEALAKAKEQARMQPSLFGDVF